MVKDSILWTLRLVEQATQRRPRPPSRLRDIDTVLYVHARTLAAEDSGAALVALDGPQQHAPAVYRTLMKRSVRWGDADDH
jgi:hypothetical protein